MVGAPEDGVAQGLLAVVGKVVGPIHLQAHLLICPGLQQGYVHTEQAIVHQVFILMRHPHHSQHCAHTPLQVGCVGQPCVLLPAPAGNVQ